MEGKQKNGERGNGKCRGKMIKARCECTLNQDTENESCDVIGFYPQSMVHKPPE